LNARIAWLKTSGSQEPSGHTGPVPDTSTRSPARIAREKPIGPSNGESDVARRRSSAIGVPPVLRRQLGLDVDVLGLLERLEPLLAELAPEPRLLVAAERPASLSVSGSLIQTVPAFSSRMQRKMVFRSRV
jgi:hypothetical protein